MYIPTQQDEGDRAPRAGSKQVGNGFLSYPSPDKLKQTGEEEGEEEQGQGLRGDIDRQCPEQGDPEFGISRTHPAIYPSEEQTNARKPDIGIAGEMCDKTGYDQREGSPVRDAACAQVI